MVLKERNAILKLSPRLQAVAELVKPGLKLADIGTDHAYLPIYLVQRGISPSAVAIDIHRGPYESALKQVALQGLEDKITVLLGNGLEPLRPGQVDVVVLAGMGSATMIEILEAKPELVLKLQQLVLQPMAGLGQIRKWLVENGWAINNEILVKDDGFIYAVLSALPGQQSISDWLTLELGPIILKEKPPLLKDYISKILSAYENIVISLAKAQSQEVEQKRLDLLEKIDLLKGVINNGFEG